MSMIMAATVVSSGANRSPAAEHRVVGLAIRYPYLKGAIVEKW